MKVQSVGPWIAGALFLLFIAWQLAEAVFFGRMADILFEDDDHIFFFESPFLFCIQIAVFVAFGVGIIYGGVKRFRKERRERMDTAPRHTHDARKR
jgi:p-aminobenzoyl-glutamate transporter AbgT